MSTALENQIIDQIIEVLRKHRSGCSFEDLLKDLPSATLSEVDIKAALWSLMADSTVELTSDSTLRLAA